MKAYQILHIKYALDKKTMKPVFNKGFFAEQQGFEKQYSAPVRFFETKDAVRKFFVEQQKSILKWNKEKNVHTNRLTANCLKIEFDPKGGGYPCEMYQAVPVNLPVRFVNSHTFKDHWWM